jgi:transposase InsO family protein
LPLTVPSSAGSIIERLVDFLRERGERREERGERRETRRMGEDARHARVHQARRRAESAKPRTRARRLCTFGGLPHYGSWTCTVRTHVALCCVSCRACPVQSCAVLCCPVLSCAVLSSPVLSAPLLSSPVLFALTALYSPVLYYYSTV